MTYGTTRGGASTLLLLAACLVLGGCGDAAVEPDNMVDSGSWYRTGFRWPHDGNPYESANFVVYSDAASLEARRELAEIGEELLVVLTNDFEVDPATMFQWPPGQSKIHIYTYKDRFEQAWGGWGYYGGLMIYSLDHPIRDTEIGNYSRVVTHELMHTIEGLLNLNSRRTRTRSSWTSGCRRALPSTCPGAPSTSRSCRPKRSSTPCWRSSVS